MKITVEDHVPGAGTGRKAYLEDRALRVLGRMSDRVESITIELRPDDQHAGHCRVGIAAQLSQGETLEVSGRRRLLADALADAFDALVTRIALKGLRRTDSEDAVAFVRTSSSSTAEQPSAF